MGIRKPGLSVKEARHLASVRSLVLNETEGSLDGARERVSNPVGSEQRHPETATTLRRKPNGPHPKIERPSPTEIVDPQLAAQGTKIEVERITLARDEETACSLAHAPASSPQARERVQVFLSAPIPANGVSSVYEFLRRQHGPQKALQMVLRKALSAYENRLSRGALLGMTETYATDEQFSSESLVQTSRMMPKIVVAAARAHFDPLGFESTRAFGRKLGTAALAAFFDSEHKTSR